MEAWRYMAGLFIKQATQQPTARQQELWDQYKDNWTTQDFKDTLGSSHIQKGNDAIVRGSVALADGDPVKAYNNAVAEGDYQTSLMLRQAYPTASFPEAPAGEQSIAGRSGYQMATRVTQQPATPQSATPQPKPAPAPQPASSQPKPATRPISEQSLQAYQQKLKSQGLTGPKDMAEYRAYHQWRKTAAPGQTGWRAYQASLGNNQQTGSAPQAHGRRPGVDYSANGYNQALNSGNKELARHIQSNMRTGSAANATAMGTPGSAVKQAAWSYDEPSDANNNSGLYGGNTMTLGNMYQPAAQQPQTPQQPAAQQPAQQQPQQQNGQQAPQSLPGGANPAQDLLHTDQQIAPQQGASPSYNNQQRFERFQQKLESQGIKNGPKTIEEYNAYKTWQQGQQKGRAGWGRYQRSLGRQQGAQPTTQPAQNQQRRTATPQAATKPYVTPDGRQLKGVSVNATGPTSTYTPNSAPTQRNGKYISQGNTHYRVTGSGALVPVSASDVNHYNNEQRYRNNPSSYWRR